MIEPLLKARLEPIARRHRRLRQWQQLTLCWGFAALIGLAVLAVHQLTGWSVSLALPALIIGAGVATLLVRRRAEAWEPDYREIARRIETQHPELHQLLLTAIEQEPDPATGKLNFLQERVVLEALAEAQKHTWLDALTARQMIGARTINLTAFALFALALGMLYQTGPIIWESGKGFTARKAKDSVTITPGDVALERGSGLIIMAKFTGNIPTEAALIIQPQNEPEQRLPLMRNLNDAAFGGGLPQVSGPLTYRVEYAGKASRDFKVSVFEFPRLERSDATLDYPDYTQLPDKTIPDTRRVAAVEGTELDVTFNLNKPVTRAELIAKDKSVIPLTLETNKAAVTLRDYAMSASQEFQLRLVDADGRTNKVPAQFVVTVLPNRPPEMKFAFPKGDQQVSALQEVGFAAELWDDFGMATYGLSFSVGGGEPKDIPFGSATKPDEKRTLAHLLKLEDLNVREDDLISWFLWAEDVGPDGQPRRTASDMYFAEVRPFERIYRPGDDSESESQSQQQGGSEALKLADLQKKIITGTWNLKRKQDAAGSKLSEQYGKDVETLRQAQAQAIEQAEALKERFTGPDVAIYVQTVNSEMERAEASLSKAAADAKELTTALSAEQAAYNSLLKLAARVFDVSQSRSRSQSRSNQERNQSELNNLEMKPRENRYEQQSQAQQEQEKAQQQEELAILNRLKELAQRQQDVNERLKELESALQEASSEQEKEELRRQLKRLQEEQQQMLADIDELNEKMQESPKQAQMSEERQRLEQAREQAQRAAESMERNDSQQAQAAGTRTQRELQELRDDYRKKTSQQFREEMRDMRSDARELAANQEEISKALQAPQQSKERRTLDGSNEREQLTEEFQRQQSTLTNLLENMRRVSQEAEAAEPLLARELYDTLRKVSQSSTEESLSYAEKLSERGYTSQARQFEEKARQEIGELKDGVERAAEAVLGDETESLRMARAELDALAEQVARELRQNAPQMAGDPTGNQRTNTMSGARGGAEPREGEPNPQQPRSGGQQPGESQSQAGETGQSQPGQRGQNANQQSDTAGQRSGQQPGSSPQEGDPQNGQGQQPQSGQPGSGQPQEGQPGQMAQAGQQGQQGQQGQAGQQPGQQSGQQAGQGGGQGQQPGQQPGQMAQGQEGSQAQGGSQRDGNRSLVDDPANRERTARQLGSSEVRRAGEIASGGGNSDGRGGNGGGGEWNLGPLRGEGFVEWSDRLRNVEEMLTDPDLRTEVARVREVARGMRVEFRRHSKEPEWDMVKTKIGDALVQLRDRVSEELARKGSKEALVPIDRDPVPGKFGELVRRYYEDLGKSQ